jgi:hypothetical protein
MSHAEPSGRVALLAGLSAAFIAVSFGFLHRRSFSTGPTSPLMEAPFGLQGLAAATILRPCAAAGVPREPGYVNCGKMFEYPPSAPGVPLELLHECESSHRGRADFCGYRNTGLG